MPKKQQRNSFYFFLVDFKKKEEESGRRLNGGLGDVAEEAGEIWKTMPATARQKYEKMAKDYKSGAQIKKYTSTGEVISEVERRRNEIEEREKLKREAVINLVSDMKTAKEKVFYLIDVNYYCQTKDKFVINEVAIVPFNVMEGLQTVFHEIIDPGSIPLGFTSYAKESQEEHCFKLPPLDMGVNSLSEVLAEIQDFLQQMGEEHQGAVALFTLEERAKAVESFLDQISVYDESVRFVLYPISTLLYALSQKLSTSKEKAVPNESVALITLKADKFQYSPNLACKFHEETEKCYNCTKSRAKRWVFTILDYCCPIANIEMIPGDHLPDDLDPEEAYQAKCRREEERERQLREEREREADVKFSFVDYAKLDDRQRERERQRYFDCAPVVAADSAWPTLGASASSNVAKPSGPWGKPAAAAAVPRPQPQPSGSAVVSRPPSSSSTGPGPTTKRAPLRKPGCDAETMFAKLTGPGADSIGITRGIGRGSVTSIHKDD